VSLINRNKKYTGKIFIIDKYYYYFETKMMLDTVPKFIKKNKIEMQRKKKRNLDAVPKFIKKNKIEMQRNSLRKIK